MKFAHSFKGITLPVSINENNCGGLTGKNMNVPKINIKQLLEGWSTSWS